MCSDQLYDIYMLKFQTIDALTDLISGFYSFLDKAKEPSQPCKIWCCKNNYEQPSTLTTDETIAIFPKAIQGFKELMNAGIKRLATTEKFKFATLNNAFDMSDYVNAKTHANFTIINVGVMGNYSNKFHAAKFNDITTVAVGGIASNPLLSYSSLIGGSIFTSIEIFESLYILGLLNNSLMPKSFPLAGMDIAFTTYEA
ncbi:12275_t:CDS:2, partial [Dentiscutata erythropus]